MFSVHDEGRGIPVDHLDKVFEAFHQVDASDTRDKSGTGLGLAISREIVETHGGRIWAEACPVRGTAFHFTIPYGAQHQASRQGHNPQLFQDPHD
jgi:signal transduction histidine kinase